MPWYVPLKPTPTLDRSFKDSPAPNIDCPRAAPYCITAPPMYAAPLYKCSPVTKIALPTFSPSLSNEFLRDPNQLASNSLSILYCSKDFPTSRMSLPNAFVSFNSVSSRFFCSSSDCPALSLPFLISLSTRFALSVAFT